MIILNASSIAKTSNINNVLSALNLNYMRIIYVNALATHMSVTLCITIMLINIDMTDQHIPSNL